MDDLKEIIAKNIADLRRDQHLTQAELAAKLNYSDKAVSKWERGESVPDIGVLKEIADTFSVTVDYLITADHTDKSAHALPPKTLRIHRTVTLLSVALVWLLATILFVCAGIFLSDLQGAWLLFIYAVPVTCIVLLVFNSLWGRRRRNYLIISALVWSLLLALFLSIAHPMIWMLFLLGIPAQLIILLWSRMGR
ncbi:MAG: helix-turn-helix transcriptional regulator [Clostridia bacterium]|nr:helix-turn-helix transcriptional regulator [Clostridia bacterium]